MTKFLNRAFVTALALAATSSLTPVSAFAGEIYGGVNAHDLGFVRDLQGHPPKIYEKGLDYELGWRSDKIASWNRLHHPSLYIHTELNDSHYTNQIGMGLTWKVPFGPSNKFYLRPGIGLAVHDGRLNLPDPNASGLTPEEKAARQAVAFDHRTEFESRVMFQPLLGIGYDITDQTSLELSWVHMSHAGLGGSENEGQDNLGLRLNHRFAPSQESQVVAAPPKPWGGEIYTGVYKHDMSFIRDLTGSASKLYETGEDFELGWRSEKTGWRHLRHPSVYIQTQINDSGDTSQVSAGLTWKITPYDNKKIHLRPGFGLAVHDGRISIPDPTEPGITPEEHARRVALALDHKNEYGSRVLWNLQFGVGYDISEHNAIDINWNHISHAFMPLPKEARGDSNQGQDNLGIRFNHRF